MILFNSTRKLKNSDGLIVLFQFFSIFEIGYFLTRTVERLVVSNPWDNWDDSDQLTMLRSATYHYVNNGFLRQTSLKSNFFGFVFPFPFHKVDFSDSVSWKSSLRSLRLKSVTHLWLAQNEAAWDRGYQKTCKPISREDRTWSIIADVDNGHYNNAVLQVSRSKRFISGSF